MYIGDYVSLLLQNVFGVFNTALHPNNAQGWMTLHNVSCNWFLVQSTMFTCNTVLPYLQATGGAAKLLDSMERYGLYRSLVAGDRESRDVSQDTNFGTSYSYPVHGPCSTSDIHMYIYMYLYSGTFYFCISRSLSADVLYCHSKSNT